MTADALTGEWCVTVSVVRDGLRRFCVLACGRRGDSLTHDYARRMHPGSAEVARDTRAHARRCRALL